MEYQNPKTIAVMCQELYSGMRSSYLLVTRESEPFIGELAFPGGWVEMGETIEQAAGREFKEEVGIEIPTPKLIHSMVGVDLPGAPTNLILAFCHSVVALEWREVYAQFRPNREVRSVHWSKGDEKLCFPTHEQTLRLLTGNPL